MHKFATTVALACMPAVLAAQASARATARTSADAQVRAPHAQADAHSSTSVDAQIELARKNRVPERPIRRRVAEGRAKGASEAQVAAAAAELRAKLEASSRTLLRAGRPHPRDEEVERGAYLLERGYTEAQIELVAKSAPRDRPLLVAFDVLSDLRARGVASERAVTQVASKLKARASDTSIRALASANAGANAGVKAPVAGVGAGAGGAVNATAGAAAGAASTGAGVAGSVTGAVGGVIRKP